MGRSRYKATYIPQHKEKYVGSFPITYRSKLEYRMMRYLDTSNSVVQWGSESTVVNYLDPTRPCVDGRPSIHRYFIDFYLITKDKAGNLTKFYIEVKPFSETLPPVKGNKRPATFMNENITYARNVSKWQAAKKFAESRKCRFILITEKDLL